jgi:general L-amino acid transport system substrate-binding protein
VLAVSCRPKTTDAPKDGGKEVIASPGAVTPADGPTLKAVKARRRLNCGVAANSPGFATRDMLGQWRGFDVDFCRAVAAAVLGDARAVHYVPVTVKTRFTQLQAGDVDLLARSGAWTFSRDVGLGLDFAGISFYDGQGFLAAKGKNFKSAADLGTNSVCVQSGTTAETNLDEYRRTEGMKFKTTVVETEDDARTAYENGTCSVLSANISFLASIRSGRKGDGDVILPDVISKEPLGPVVRQSDDQWADIIRWTLNAMVLGEELGIDTKNVDSARSNPRTPEIGRLLSGDGYGEMMRVNDDWAFQIFRQVGNYAEVFERNIGPASSIGLERDQNALWNAGRPGLMYAPPMR